MTYLAPEHLRLEVEKPTTGLRNMVANPDGRLGGWGWITTGGSSMGGGPDTVYGVVGPKLVFTSAGYSEASPLAHVFATEWMPLNEGQGVAATWVAGYTGGATYAARFQFADAAGNFVPIYPDGPQGYFAASASPRLLGPYVAPAATRKVRLLFTAGTAAGLEFVLQKVTVARAPLLSALGTLRVNRALQPSGETGPPTLWTPFNAYYDRASGGVSGSWAIRATCISGGAGTTMGVRVPTEAPVNPGATYTGSIYFAAAATPRLVRLTIGWSDVNGNVITSSDTGWQGGESTSLYTRISHIATAPATAYYALMSLEWQNPDSGEVHFADAAMLELGNTVGTYFDGGTVPPAGFQNAYFDNGSSAQTSSNLQYVEPVTWLEIAPSTGSIDVGREALNIGTLTAVIRDAALDPATTDALRSGRKVRLFANNRLVFTGEISNADVAYTKPKDSDPEVTGTITLTALDATSRLAQHPAPRGVRYVDELPYVLEGGGVPWLVYGSDDQVPDSPETFLNESATALDQVTLTAMSRRAHAYVSREGVLIINGAPPTSGVTLSDVARPSYVDASVGLSTDECVNSVTVSWVGNIGGETTTVTYGPYEDFDSIESYGRHAQTFTIQGEDAITTWALQTLAANATPQVKIRSITFVVDELADIDTVLAMELTHRVSVVWQGKTYIGRVESVRHEITAQADWLRPVAWRSTITFALPTTTQLPTYVPTP